MSIDLENIFVYMDFLNAGYSPEEINQAFLDPMQEENEARYREESIRLIALLKESLKKRQTENGKALSEVEAIDITSVAREEAKICQENLKQMEELTSPLEGLLQRKKEDLAISHENHEQLTETFRNLNTELHSTPMEPSWIDRTKLAQRGAEICKQRSSSEGYKYKPSPKSIDFAAQAREILEKSQKDTQGSLQRSEESQKSLKEMAAKISDYVKET